MSAAVYRFRCCPHCADDVIHDVDDDDHELPCNVLGVDGPCPGAFRSFLVPVPADLVGPAQLDQDSKEGTAL